ncbi:MAG: non-ribosomal peptide synthetase, partial [Cyanobacteriota bacterium]|nr:non-ribosomal peptide synthetase [Cyanobacteriota bacterium]
EMVSQAGIERLFLPFVALTQLAMAAQRRAIPLCLREVITAGEQLQITPAIASLFAALPDCTLDNQYGPSETHVATAYLLAGAPENWPLLPPIGTGIANTNLYLLDRHQNLVPPGLPGEICVGGTAVARGYLNRPELSRDRFIDNPFGEGKLYKTGDLAREDRHGNLHYLGRRDNQVKLRGFRLELGEIEAVLASFPGAREVAAAIREFDGGERRLIAYLVPQSPAAAATAELQAFLRHRLPDYLLPSAIVWLDALPLTPSGKLDRRSLPSPSRDRPELGTTYVAPKTPLERQIAEIWQNLLQVDRIGTNDNFFDLGGHSLLMIQVRRQLETQLEREIPLVTLFQYPTAIALARHLNPGIETPSSADALRDRAQRRAAKRRREY